MTTPISWTSTKALIRCACLALGLSVTGTTNAYILFGQGYAPQTDDTYVGADAGVCCIGEYHTLTNNYLAQTFEATGARPTSLTLGLANNLPSDVPPASFRFRLLFAEVQPGSFHPGQILWESEDISIPAAISGFNEWSFPVSGATFVVGFTYAWVLDTYSTRDGFEDVGVWFGNIGYNVPPYLKGDLFLAQASGAGRDADFSSQWRPAGSDAAFLIRYAAVPEPGMLVLLGLGLAGLGFSRRRQ